MSQLGICKKDTFSFKLRLSVGAFPGYNTAIQNKIRFEGEITMSKKLYKSNTNKMLEGVCGGIAEYFGVDPTIVRLAWVVFCALGGSGILAYIIAAIIIPSAPLE